MRKRIERSAKRFLIRIATSVVRTRPVRPEEILRGPLRRILIVRQQNQMGDMLLATPAFRAVKERFSQTEITVLTARINRGVLLNSPHVSGLLTYTRNPLTLAPMIRDMRRARFDLAIVLHTVSFSFTSALLGLISGARYRVGSTSRPFGNALSRSFYHMELPLPAPDELRSMNEAEHNIYPLRSLGIDGVDLAPVLVPDARSGSWAREFMRASARPDRTTIAVHPGAGKAENIWPPENFAAVVRKLAAHTPLNLIVIEGPRDARPVERFLEAAGIEGTVVRRRSIAEVAAVLLRCDLVVCNDSGVMHVACAAGARTVGIFGPTDPVRWAPRSPGLTVVKAPGGDLRALDAGEVHDRVAECLRPPSRAEGAPARVRNRP